MPAKTPVRGSTTGKPIMVLLEALGERWALRILWELRAEPLSFRALQQACGGISPTVLNTRLKRLRELQLVELADQGYGLTEWGQEVGNQFTVLTKWSERWGKSVL